MILILWQGVKIIYCFIVAFVKGILMAAVGAFVVGIPAAIIFTILALPVGVFLAVWLGKDFALAIDRWYVVRYIIIYSVFGGMFLGYIYGLISGFRNTVYRLFD